MTASSGSDTADCRYAPGPGRNQSLTRDSSRSSRDGDSTQRRNTPHSHTTGATGNSPEPRAHRKSNCVRVGVYNKGTAPAGPFTVRWWPGENYPTPGCEWPVESLVASGGRILTCNYAGYPSWYAKLNTKVVVDTGATVAESDEANNTLTREISVAKP
jgi:hypothetical protein